MSDNAVVGASTGAPLFRQPGMRYSSILLASHGTDGARAAERLALELCAAGGEIHHLYVVPDLWKGMMGDDWLNNVRTRIRFGEYLEGQLEKEMQVHLDRVEKLTQAADLSYDPIIRVGEPSTCLLAELERLSCDLVVIGAPRPKGVEGLRSRMRLDEVLRASPVPVMIAPYSRD